MTQTTNGENENGYAWARRPDGTSPARATVTGRPAISPSADQGGHSPALTDDSGSRDQSGFDRPGYAGQTHTGQSQPGQSDEAQTYSGRYHAPGYGSQGYQDQDHNNPSYSSPGYAGQSYGSQTSTGAGAPRYAAPDYAPTSWMQTAGTGTDNAPLSVGGSGFGVAPPSGRGGRPARQPGWAGVIAVGAGAAVLSSLLTAGIVLQTRQDPVTSSAPTRNSAPVEAPVVGSSTTNPDWGKVAAAVEPSVVAVQVNSRTGGGEGSGVILDKTGRIVTNNHVVSGGSNGSEVEVVLSDGRIYPATIVGTDASTDLAVLTLTNPPDDLVPAVLGDSSAVAVGDPVMAVGNPLGLAGTVTTGIVSATDRPTTTAAESNDPNSAGTETVITNAIQTDAAVNPGNSGGALVDAQGRVIGIPSSIATLGRSNGQAQSGSIGLGFAIPIDEVKDVSSQLIETGTVAHAWLGVGPSDGTVATDGARRDAAILTEIISGGPAEEAGLQPGDAVIAVDGESVNTAISLVGQLREREAGATVTLTVVRDGQTSEIEVTLGARPTN